MLSFIQKLFTHETAIAHNEHVITVEKGYFRTTVCYLDDERMLVFSTSPQMSALEYERWAKTTTDDRNEVTYSVLLQPKFWGNSILVEVFDGDSWRGHGQFIYSS